MKYNPQNLWKHCSVRQIFCNVSLTVIWWQLPLSFLNGEMGTEGSSVHFCWKYACWLVCTVMVHQAHSSLWLKLRCYTGLKFSYISVDYYLLYKDIHRKIWKKLSKVMPIFEFTSQNPAEVTLAALLKLVVFSHYWQENWILKCLHTCIKEKSSQKWVKIISTASHVSWNMQSEQIQHCLIFWKIRYDSRFSFVLLMSEGKNVLHIRTNFCARYNLTAK